MESKNYKTYISYSDSKTDITATTPDINSDGVSVVSNTDNNINVIQDDKFYKTDIGNINQKLYDRINGDTPDSSLHLNYNDKCFLVEISTAQNQGDNAISVKVKNLDDNEICKQKNSTSTIKLLNECEFTLHTFEESKNSPGAKIIKGSVDIILDAKPKNESEGVGVGASESKSRGGGGGGGGGGGEDEDEDEESLPPEAEPKKPPPPAADGGASESKGEVKVGPGPEGAQPTHAERKVLEKATNSDDQLVIKSIKEWKNFVGKKNSGWGSTGGKKTKKLQDYFITIKPNRAHYNQRMDKELYDLHANNNNSKLANQIKRNATGYSMDNRAKRRHRRYSSGLNAAIHKVLKGSNSSKILDDPEAFKIFKKNVKKAIIEKNGEQTNKKNKRENKFKIAERDAPGYGDEITD